MAFKSQKPTHRLNVKSLCWWVGSPEAMVGMDSVTPTHPPDLIGLFPPIV